MARPKRQCRTLSKEAYEFFKKEYPNIDLPFNKWQSIIRTCNWMYMDNILNTGHVLRLPHGFGDLTVTKRKTFMTHPQTGERVARLPIDWKRTKQEGTYVYHLNFHSSGWRFKWFWQPKTSRLKQPQVWVLKPTRRASRELSKYILKDNYYVDMYIEYTKTRTL